MAGKIKNKQETVTNREKNVVDIKEKIEFLKMEFKLKFGCKFDSWGEFFNYDNWIKAFEMADVDIKYFTERKMDLSERLAWDNIDILVSKEFLKREYNNSLEGKVTPNCRAKCNGCGIQNCPCWEV